MQLVKGGLFDGIGGFDIASDWMGWQNAFHCEQDEFCKKVLNYYWKNAVNYGDITKADFSVWKNRIHVLTGGFPCQPFSTAGKRNGTTDYRYLWPEMLKAIKTIRPHWVIGENVAGILSMEDKSAVSKEVFFRVDRRNIAHLQEVDHYEAVYVQQSRMLLANILQDLEEAGYSVQTFIVPASAAQAPHRRDRTWIVAHANSEGHQLQEPSQNRSQKGKGKSKEDKRQRVWSNSRGISLKGHAAHTQHNGLHTTQRGCSHAENSERGTKRQNGTQQLKGVPEPRELESVRKENVPNTTSTGKRQDNRKGNPKQFNQDSQNEYWQNFPTQPPVCSRNDGFSAKLDGITFSKWRNQSIKGYGNAIVPQVVMEFYKAIQLEYDKLN